jgi:hypothetical protein
LILLDCCSSGIGDAGEGNGVTELMSACAFDVTANGVGHYSFTKALTIELRLLSKKRSFSVVELYTHIYCRAQHHIAQGVDNERYPAPIHLLLTQDDHFPRSIQLSIQDEYAPQHAGLGSEHSNPGLHLSESVNHKRRSFKESPEPSNKRPCLDRNSQRSQAGVGSSITQYLSTAPQEDVAHNDCAALEITSSNDNSIIPGGYPRDLLGPVRAPRLLFAVRLEDNIRAEDLSPEYFAAWLRMIPTIAKEVRIEAGFECNSTLLLVSLPLSLWPYLSRHSAIISLGPIKSSNLLVRRHPHLLVRRHPHGESAMTRMNSPTPSEMAEDETRAVPSGGIVAQETPQAGNHSDTGSEGCLELDIYDTQSLGSVCQYIEENGRTYHSFRKGRYMFPNDEPELDRLDIQHHLFFLTFGCKLFISPITQTKRVLDAGTGTGIWAMQFADKYPEAEVFGIDLSPIQPKFVPPNLTFIIDDLEEDYWTCGANFDFIYSRMMTASFRDWPRFLASSFR